MKTCFRCHIQFQTTEHLLVRGKLSDCIHTYKFQCKMLAPIVHIRTTKRCWVVLNWIWHLKHVENSTTGFGKEKYRKIFVDLFCLFYILRLARKNLTKNRKNPTAVFCLLHTKIGKEKSNNNKKNS